MHQALFLLMRLQLRGWFRGLRRTLGTVKGALLAAVGAFVMFSWLVSALLTPAASKRPDPEYVQRFGPLGLLAITVLTMIFSSGGKSVTFTPAEVDFLFPGPFTRRQLLAYKIAGTVGLAALSTLILTLFTRNFANWFLAAYIGVFLTFLFIQFFSTAASFVAQTIGARAYTRGRKVVLILLGLAAAAAVVQAWSTAPEQDLPAILERMEESTVWHVVRAPLSWFTNAYSAERLWPDLIQWAGLAFLVDVILVALIFTLDAQYLEAAAAASERLYALRQKLRSGQGTLVAGSSSRPPRFRMPSLPFWAGLGPTLWRQWATAVRGYMPVLLSLAYLGMTVPLLLSLPAETTAGPELSILLTGILSGLTMLVTQATPCDFRGDLDRMDVLKTLPISSVRLGLGQVLAPTLLVGALHVFTILVVAAVLRRPDPGLLAVAMFTVPFAFLVFTLDNLLFLFFPTRSPGAAPGDIQAMGRNVLLIMGRFFCLGPAIALAIFVGAVAYFVAGQRWSAALVAAGAVMAACGGALIPLVTLAFNRFDVARDTPP
jgi:hypothetical protein